MDAGKDRGLQSGSTTGGWQREPAGPAEHLADLAGPRESEPPSAHDDAGRTVEMLVEAIPAAVSLVPSGGLGGEIPLEIPLEVPVDGAKQTGVESMRSGLLQAGPLAAAGVLANGANVLVTVGVARILSSHSYGALNQLTGLFLILSMPGSAVVVAVVRRVTMWQDSGAAHLVRRWAGRVHRQGFLAVVIWALAVFAARNWIGSLLGQRNGIGSAAILTAAAFFVLLSLDRGLLQAHRAYRPLAVNLLVEGGMRSIGVLALVGAGKGSSGAAVGILIGEAITAAHARYAAVRVWSVSASASMDGGGRRPSVAAWAASVGLASWASGWMAAVRPDHVLDGSRLARHRVIVDLVVASLSLSMVAVLQNVDVLIVGRDSPSHSGAYAAVSVTSKAIVFGAVVLGGYLLPEATIRWRQGGHALRQLGVVLVFLSIPAAALLVVAIATPHLLLRVVFHHAYTSAAPALAPLGGAMVMLSISVILTMYLLAIGRRWVLGVLALGGLALALAVAAVHGKPHATALVDLAVQAGVLVVILVGFAGAHRVRVRVRVRGRVRTPGPGAPRSAPV
jgi:O-antigen/teichoic acid export membrane protein